MANEQGVILEDVRGQMALDLQVYDLDGTKVGTIVQYDTDAGWMMVQQGVFTEKDLYIPFSTITSIDPREVYVSQPKDVLKRDYSSPPARTTVVEETAEPGVVETTALTMEPSGYDGAPLVVERTHVDDLKGQIATNMRVYTASGDEIGKIKRYDAVTGWMLVEKGLLTRRDLYVPVTVVETVDRAENAVYLTFSKDDLQRLSDAEPVDVFFVEAQLS